MSLTAFVNKCYPGGISYIFRCNPPSELFSDVESIFFSSSSSTGPSCDGTARTLRKKENGVDIDHHDFTFNCLFMYAEISRKVCVSVTILLIICS